jgi:ABC-2 type transport system permease protein
MTATDTLATPSADTAAWPRPRRHPSTTRRLLATELRLLTRDTITFTFVLAFPVISMLIIGGVFGTEPDEAFPVNPSHWYVASYFTVVIGSTGLIMLPVHMASYRERGVLRRFAASGFPRWSFALAEAFPTSRTRSVSPRAWSPGRSRSSASACCSGPCCPPPVRRSRSA